MRKALLILLLPMSATSACAPFAAASRPPTIQSAACSSLLPDSWRTPVDAPPLPDGSTVGDWVAFSDAALGKLDVANDRLTSSIDIVSRCEARDAAALKKATSRRFFGLF